MTVRRTRHRQESPHGGGTGGLLGETAGPDRLLSQLEVCPEWESNPHGGNPPQDFKSCVSASFAIRALWPTAPLTSELINNSPRRRSVADEDVLGVAADDLADVHPHHGPSPCRELDPISYQRVGGFFRQEAHHGIEPFPFPRISGVVLRGITSPPGTVRQASLNPTRLRRQPHRGVVAWGREGRPRRSGRPVSLTRT